MLGLKRIRGEKSGGGKLFVYLIIFLGLITFVALEVFADGTETLGTPSITIANGTGIVANGTGLVDITQPGTIYLDIPAGVTVKQVLLYWVGRSTTDHGGYDIIEVDGSNITGTQIGYTSDPKLWHSAMTYRADITNDVTISPGMNTLKVGGLDFGYRNDGAGIVVIIDDGSGTSDIQLRDGNDWAYIKSDGVLKVTVAQTFSFAPESSDRTAELLLFFGDGKDEGRPNTIEITIDGYTMELYDEIRGQDGNQWDTITLPLSIPAGNTSVTVQAFSDDRLVTGGTPSSLIWSLAGLTVPLPSQVCDLSVDKTATPDNIIPSPAPSCKTEGKPTSLRFKYVGGGCDASDHDQGSKARCSGSIDGFSSVTVMAAGGKKGNKAYTVSPMNVNPSDEFTVFPANTNFDSNSIIWLENTGGTEINKIHTSCSQPLAVGDVFGSLMLAAINNITGTGNEVTYEYEITNNGDALSNVSVYDDELGLIAGPINLGAGETRIFTKVAWIFENTTNLVTVEGQLAEGQICEASDTVTVTVEELEEPPGSCDDGKPRALVFNYTGESCTASDHDQGGKAKCSGDPVMNDPVRIVYTGKDQSKITVSPAGQTITLNDLVIVEATGRERLHSNTKLEIQDANFLQKLEIHTSCSQPLNVGDQFGSLILQEFIPE